MPLSYRPQSSICLGRAVHRRSRPRGTCRLSGGVKDLIAHVAVCHFIQDVASSSFVFPHSRATFCRHFRCLISIILRRASAKPGFLSRALFFPVLFMLFNQFRTGTIYSTSRTGFYVGAKYICQRAAAGHAPSTQFDRELLTYREEWVSRRTPELKVDILQRPARAGQEARAMPNKSRATEAPDRQLPSRSVCNPYPPINLCYKRRTRAKA